MPYDEAFIAALLERMRFFEEELARKDAIIERQAQVIAKLEQRVEELEESNRRLLRWRFGARTEKSTAEAEEAQALIELIGWTCPLDTQAAMPTSADHQPGNVEQKREPKKPGRRPLWSQVCPHLPVDEVVHQLSGDDLIDADGRLLVRAGTETREELVYLPGSVRIRRVQRARYAQAGTNEKVATAPGPDRIVPRGALANDTILASVVHHAADCLPFHRQAEMIARLGAPVTRQTLTQGFHSWCELAAPLVDAMQRQVLDTDVLHVDGSFVFRQDRTSKRRRCTRSPLYAISDGQQVVLRWRPDEKHATAADLIPGYRGYLVRDEWKGWYGLQKVDVQHVACNAHARRPFAEVQRDDRDAARMIALYAQLYEVERTAQATQMTGDTLAAYRHHLRTRNSIAIMDAIEAFAAELADRRTGTIGRAARYILKHRSELRLFLRDGHIPVDNNLAERVLRRNALLRKNRLFFVAEGGGTNLGIALSVCGSCRLLDINPLAYLADCLPALLAYRRAAQQDDASRPDLSGATPLAYARRSRAITTAA